MAGRAVPGTGRSRGLPKGENGKLLRACQRAGLRVEKGKKHWKVYDGGALVAVMNGRRGRSGSDRAREALRPYGIAA